MALARDPTGAEIARFIATRTGAQMVQLMRCIKEPAAQAAFTAKLLVAPPAMSGRPATPEKARKALNAFVGFRCKPHLHYYTCYKLIQVFRLLHHDSNV